MVWPPDYKRRWTVAAEAVLAGVGLHSGLASRVTLIPSPSGGLTMALEDAAPVPLGPGLAREQRLCTALQLPTGLIHTVEHLLAALVGVGISDVRIQVEGREIPLLDGSALPWVEAVATVGLRPLAGERSPLVVREMTCIRAGDGHVLALPHDGLRLSVAVNYPSRAIGQQFYEVDLTPERFVEHVAPARTFGFQDQLDALRSAGLIQGGSLQNALVCDDRHWLNPPLRFPNEPVRHKLLDLIGDLALLGCFPHGHVSAYRAGHALHTRLAARLAMSCSAPTTPHPTDDPIHHPARSNPGQYPEPGVAQ
ncbi:MAG: UDP-3-O-acyl-N-acetylglucosamine deacetylase [Synechococcus sp. SB0669_bin_7]|nr:UDP-3-O-acyl-N-acetylglucosamine deacetylase [Cyanobacteria bacterium MAG IRC3_bin_20]MYG63378.1 UDP-3-O-acyl-N-acetylglucosamine deacetylase [Synechococcus sp. SB0675_bin_7]MYK85563.1 UDP-3-O-acyl-N-acetylglucosamine deacetylase [Synechococcus sp. SB0669_bin_7]